MIDVANREEIRKLDPKNVYDSTGMLASQCEQIWQDAKTLSFPQQYKEVKNIVICGMGGSAYGAHVALTLLKDQLTLPLVLVSDYTLPAFVDNNTLVVLTSYSGTTEECVQAGEKALKRNAKVVVLSSGGKLQQMMTEHSLPGLIFNTQFNPSGQPRLGTGYIVLGTAALFARLGFLTISDETVSQAIAELKAAQEAIQKNAIDIAQKLLGTIPVVFAAEFLEGNAHIIRNQFNETAKSFSAYSELPELNHHLMEGLKNPPDKKLSVLFLDSTLYSPILQKRITLTKDVVTKNTVPVLSYQVDGSTPLSQMMNALSFGGYITIYLGLLYGLDPSLIPWVDYFKHQLAK